MSESNSSSEFENILFEVNGDAEALRRGSIVRNINSLRMAFEDNLSLGNVSNELMSIDEFLDLVPANCYFH